MLWSEVVSVANKTAGAEENSGIIVKMGDKLYAVDSVNANSENIVLNIGNEIKEDGKCKFYDEFTETQKVSDFMRGFTFARYGIMKDTTEVKVGRCSGTREYERVNCGGCVDCCEHKH